VAGIRPSKSLRLAIVEMYLVQPVKDKNLLRIIDKWNSNICFLGFLRRLHAIKT
jgi:hypothetical protein